MKTTDVFIVLDQSASMNGPKTETARKMVYEMADVLAREERYTSVAELQRFNVFIIPFGSTVGLIAPQTPSQLLQHWPASIPANLSLGGMTALRDAIGKALELSAKSPAQAQLISAFTDGIENHSYLYSVARLKTELQRQELLGKLTLTMAGPAEARKQLSEVGIPEANFRQWDGSEQGLVETAKATTTALDTYVQQRRTGVTRSSGFYADLSQVTPAGVRANTKQVFPREVRTVTRHMSGRAIADFYGSKFQQGSHYYQLVKPEYLQEDKDLVVFIKDKGEYRQGSRAVRSLMGLPETGKIRVYPGKLDQYDLFVQSTSNNRKVVEGQQMLTL